MDSSSSVVVKEKIKKKPLCTATGYDKNMEYEVEKIVNERTYFNNGRVEYFVKWLDWDSTTNTWEPKKTLQKKAAGVIQEWEETKRKKLVRTNRDTDTSSPALSMLSCSKEQGEIPTRKGKRSRTEDALMDASVGSYILDENGSESSTGVTNKVMVKELQKLQLELHVEKEDLLVPILDKNDESTESSTYSVDFDFVCGLNRLSEKLKNSVIELCQKQIENQSKRVEEKMLEVKERDIHELKTLNAQLKADNAHLKKDMDGLNLFLMHKKEPEKSLRNKIDELEKQLATAQAENTALIKNGRVMNSSGLEEGSEEMKETLAKVAQLFSGVLGYKVSRTGVLRTLPLVQTIVEENAKKAEKVTKFQDILND